ncbi:hypothetical protein [Winogradskya consettensis]|nr:hypothetical protein [Actinoplanes consettensis]
MTGKTIGTCHGFMNGSFTIRWYAACADEDEVICQCIRQMPEQTPIVWTSGHTEPSTLLGNVSECP